MAFLYPVESTVSFEGKTLVFPIVSTANIGQLAADLLIESLSLKRIALGDPGYFIPAVAAREGGELGVTVPLEAYGSDTHKIVVFQQRSPVLKSRKQEFVDDLLSFLRQSRCATVLFLSGVDLTDRTDAQMTIPTYQYPSPANSPSAASLLQTLSSLPIPTYSFPSSNSPEVPFIPGGGLTRRILSSLPSEWTIPTSSLLHFAVEGDNRADAALFASVVAKVLDVEVKTWRHPGSWSGLFGTPHDQSLYG